METWLYKNSILLPINIQLHLTRLRAYIKVHINIILNKSNRVPNIGTVQRYPN